MNKAELVAEIAKESGMSKSDSSKVLDATLEAISKALKDRQEVRLVGFGTFTTRERKETMGRNPRTGEGIVIPAAILPVFRPGKLLKEEVS